MVEERGEEKVGVRRRPSGRGTGEPPRERSSRRIRVSWSSCAGGHSAFPAPTAAPCDRRSGPRCWTWTRRGWSPAAPVPLEYQPWSRRRSLEYHRGVGGSRWAADPPWSPPGHRHGSTPRSSRSSARSGGPGHPDRLQGCAPRAPISERLAAGSGDHRVSPHCCNSEESNDEFTHSPSARRAPRCESARVSIGPRMTMRSASSTPTARS